MQEPSQYDSLYTILAQYQPVSRCTNSLPSYQKQVEKLSFKLLTPDNSPMLEASYLTCFSWNIEGLRRNIHSLKHFIGLHDPHLIFLSEPQIFQCDIDSLFKTLEGQFSFHLNSEDLLHPELALEHHKAKGGTLALWKSSLDPFVTVIPTLSSSALAIALA